MSRSYKKNRILKYGKYITKAEANRKFRRVNKIRVCLGLEPLISKELINPYDINDIIWIDKKNNPGYDKYFKK